MKVTFDVEWWSKCTTSDRGEGPVADRHREALAKTAARVIADQVAQGATEGDLHEVVFDTSDETDRGSHYSGMWFLVRAV